MKNESPVLSREEKEELLMRWVRNLPDESIDLILNHLQSEKNGPQTNQEQILNWVDEIIEEDSEVLQRLHDEQILKKS